MHPSKTLVYISSLPCDAAARFEVERQMALAGVLVAGLVWEDRFARYDWDLVRRQLEEADGFLLVLGDQYGPTTPTGISMQHRELVHALSLGKSVYCFMYNSMSAGGKSDPRLNELRDQVRKQAPVKVWHLTDELSVHAGTLARNWIKDTESRGAAAKAQLSDSPITVSKPASSGRSQPPREDIELVTQSNVYRGGNLAHQIVRLPMKSDRLWRSLQPLLRLGTSEDRLRTHVEQVVASEVKSILLGNNPGSHAVDGIRVERNQFRQILDNWQKGGYIEGRRDGARVQWSLK